MTGQIIEVFFILLILSIVAFVVIGFLYGYYDLKLKLYLKKNKMERYNSLWGEHSAIIKDSIKTYQRIWGYYHSNLDEDDNVIKKYKELVLASRKIEFFILTIIIFLSFIIILTNFN